MNPPAVKLDTKEARDAIFAKLFANVVPADHRAPTVVQLLEPFREQIEQKRHEGYSLRQIREAIRLDPIGIHASNATLVKFLGGRSKKRRTKARGPVIRMPIVPLDAAPGG